MTILGRLKILLAGLGMLPILLGVAKAQQPPIVEKLAKTYGLDSFGQVEAIRYTFSAKLSSIELSRSWIWEPKTDRVTYEGKDKSGNPVNVTYLRPELDKQSAQVKQEIDPAFINDQYWQILPFHVAWDGAKVESAGTQKLPLGEGSAEKVLVKYSSDGYSPGDTWELYIGADGRIQEIVYRRGGSAKPSVVAAAWSDYKNAGPLLFSLDHPGTADGNPVQVSFSNVAVKLTGSSAWIEAE